ncbi:MAG: flagellar protein FliT [Burkholderiaceae bacterium]|jgi:flagellar protein FliT|nr:flagellar protein FliT [Burkholderiaceae bacterium]
MPPPDDGRAVRTRAPGGAPRLIQRYEAIAQASRRMLCAARSEDWDEVARLEDRCRDLIAELKAASRTERLSASEQRRRIELLRGILADDAEIRARAEPWLRQLERLIPASRGTPRARP